MSQFGRTHWTPAAVLGTLLCLLFLVFAIAIGAGVFRDEWQPPLRITAGNPEGTYFKLATSMAEVLQAELALEEGEVSVAASSGSHENLERIRDGSADLALVQNDTLVESKARALAALYEEYLHVVVAADSEIDDIRELAGKTVSMGPIGSGTESVARRILHHFDLHEAQDEATGRLAPYRRAERLYADQLREPSQVMQALRAVSSAEGPRVDAAFVLSALPSQTVRRASMEGGIRLLSLGSGPSGATPADAIAALYPFYSSTHISLSTYGDVPGDEVRTISVTALLVANEDLDEDVVQEITAALFAGRTRMAQSQPVALQVRERYAPEDVRLPYHVGAVRYYNRDEPHFFIEYAEIIGLLMSGLVGLGSLVVTAYAFMRQRAKDRIDVFYQKLEALSVRIAAGQSDADQLRAELYAVRRDAFEQLVQERLHANDSFIIFQDYLRALLLELDGERAKSCETE